MAYGLALHTTSAFLGMAMIDLTSQPTLTDDRQRLLDRTLIRSTELDLGREMLTQLQLALRNFLTPQTWQDLAWLAVARGPGSFTSTRVGMVAARTLGQQLDLPVFAISTLAAATWTQLATIAQTTGEVSTSDWAVTLPASRGEVFGGIYRWSPATASGQLRCLREDEAMSPEAWAAVVAAWSGELRSLATQFNQVEADTVAIAAIARDAWLRGDRPHWSTALPFYGQHPVM